MDNAKNEKPASHGGARQNAGRKPISADGAKTSQIYIRVTEKEKAEIENRAKAAGMKVSAWVLSQLLRRWVVGKKTNVSRLTCIKIYASLKKGNAPDSIGSASTDIAKSRQSGSDYGGFIFYSYFLR